MPLERNLTMRLLKLLSIALFISNHIYASPVITWASDPVSPDQAVMVSGWDFSRNFTVETGRLLDSRAGLPSNSKYKVENWQVVEAVQPVENAFKFILPANLQQGIFACRVKTDDNEDVHLINRPDPWWLQADNAANATAGGWIRVFGKSLSFPNVSPSMVIAKKGTEDFTSLVLKNATPEQLWAAVPMNIETGTYNVYVHNGFGGPAMRINAGTVKIRPEPKSDEKIFDVTNFGVEPSMPSYYSWNPDMFSVKPDSSEGLQRTLDAAGRVGGVVYLPRGIYSCSKMLNVPENVTIRGAGRHLAAIEWSDIDPPRPACLYGTSNFTVEDISLYALNHYAVIRGNSGIEENSGNISIRKVTLRADRFLTCESPRHYDNYKEIFESRLKDNNRVGALNFGGPDIEIIDCDIYSSRLVLSLDKTGGIIAGNRFTSRPEHWNIFIRGANKLIFENNKCADGGVSISNVHHSPHFDEKGVRLRSGTQTSRASYVYCANNDFRDSYTKDRDGGVNSDFHSPTGLFFGKVKKAAGPKVTFDGKFWSQPGKEWLGAAVIITDGKGAGQYRNVIAFEGRDTVILERPFEVEPDGSSWTALSKSIDHQIYADNTISDAGNGIFFWCGGIESIACRNRIIRAGTVNVNSIWHGGFLPAVNVQFIENQIPEGINWGAAYIHLRGSLIGAISYPPVYASSPEFLKNEQKHYRPDKRAPDYRGPMTMMQVIRNNRILNNGSYYVGGMVNNVLLDGNYIADSAIGVEITNSGGRWQDWFGGGPENVLVRDTKMVNVTTPLVNKCGKQTLIMD